MFETTTWDLENENIKVNANAEVLIYQMLQLSMYYTRGP